ncbi:hypothetical protein SSTU70S_03289 [Stutzerimonas stutzeri]
MCQPLDQLAHLMFLVRVETVGGLIEDQHARIVEDRLRQSDAALEALGQCLDGLAEHLLQLHLRDRRLDPLALGRATETAHLGDEFEEAAHAHVAITGRAFGQIADLALGLQRLRLDVVAEDAGAAGGRREEAGQHLHGGGLAGAVRAEKAQHLARLDAERQGIHRRVLGESFRQTS